MCMRMCVWESVHVCMRACARVNSCQKGPRNKYVWTYMATLRNTLTKLYQSELYFHMPTFGIFSSFFFHVHACMMWTLYTILSMGMYILCLCTVATCTPSYWVKDLSELTQLLLSGCGVWMWQPPFPLPPPLKYFRKWNEYNNGSCDYVTFLAWCVFKCTGWHRSWFSCNLLHINVCRK